MAPHSFDPSLGRWALAACAACLATGCDTLFLEREPEVAHIQLSSDEVSELTLVTSQWFVEVADQECVEAGNIGCPTEIHLVQSDTTTVALPFTRSYPFTSRLQFFAEAYTSPPTEATLAMQVHLDDKEWYNDSRRLLIVGADGEQETLRFVYSYTVLTLP